MTFLFALWLYSFLAERGALEWDRTEYQSAEGIYIS